MPGLFGDVRGDRRAPAGQAVPAVREKRGVPAAVGSDVTSKCCATCAHYADLPADSMNRRCNLRVSWPYALYEGCGDYAAKGAEKEPTP